MYGQFIGKGDDSQESALQFIDRCPETIAILFLQLDADGRLNDSNAHLFRQVWALAQDLIFEIQREFIGRHSQRLTKERAARKSAARKVSLPRMTTLGASGLQALETMTLAR